MGNLLYVLIIIFIGLVIFIKKGSKNKKKNDNHSYDQYSSDQVSVVANQNFYKKKLINNSEKIIFHHLMSLSKDFHDQIYIFPQVNLGEFIGSPNKSAFFMINTKRSDFLITDKHFNPLVLVEYHGEGHYKGNYKMRDEVKRIAATKAKIVYFPILFNDNTHQKIDELRNVLSRY